ncbi:GxxExxY protein [Syntrophomonas palmitatica]|uniref:GxxExxY protein n=1 Tax=Syntrophomonas palmitatica TaxID=402877 RepID=UPI0006D03C26|nr:GxxExxY protein [Syntrophomonas palmitatica]
MEYLHEDMTKKIIACAYKVHNTLGAGFLEKVYENALKIELEREGFLTEKQKAITVYYEEIPVGEYYTDLLVDEMLIIEIKVAAAIDKAHESQLINYLKATGIKLGLLINFGTRVNVRRIIV